MTTQDIRIPIAAPGRAYTAQKEAIDSAIAEVLHQGHYIQGVQCQAFEKSFANWLGVPHGIAVASGTDALTIALKSVGLAHGDAIVTASNTAGATIAAIQACGCTPILADIDKATMNISVESAREVIEDWKDDYPIRAIIPVHMYGQAAAMNDILELAKQFDLKVIEDAAQAHGASWTNQRVGSWGHAAAFSFYPTKNLGAFGDAGMLVTPHEQVESQARELRQYGWRERQISYQQGINSRMDEIQAAILTTRLSLLDEETSRRQNIAKRYAQAWTNIPELQLPQQDERATHVFHQFVIKHPQRDALANHLHQDGIDTAVLYPKPVHQQPAWTNLPRPKTNGLPISEQNATQILSLPVHPFLREEEVERIIAAVSNNASK